MFRVKLNQGLSTCILFFLKPSDEPEFFSPDGTILPVYLKFGPSPPKNKMVAPLRISLFK